MTEDCRTLLQKLRAIDLAIVDSGLYLNAYACPEAAAYFDKLCKERSALADTYAKCCAPLTKCTATDGKSWTDTPWPWELEAN